MDPRVINPFLKATSEVTRQLLCLDITYRKPYIKKTPFISKGILVIIGLVGAVKGKMMLSLSKENATKIAQIMMYELTEENEELLQSAMGEYSNILIGNTSRNMSENGIDVIITSPTILEGDQIKINQKDSVISIPALIGEDIEIEFFLSVE